MTTLALHALTAAIGSEVVGVHLADVPTDAELAVELQIGRAHV